jgi:hypothetical protein
VYTNHFIITNTFEEEMKSPMKRNVLKQPKHIHNVSNSSILNSPWKWGHDVLMFPTMCIKDGIFGGIMLGSSKFSHLIII